MATVSAWTPFGVALDITAIGGTVTRTSATTYTVQISASWKTHWSGAKTKYGMEASSGGNAITLKTFNNVSASSGSGSFVGTYSISGNGSATKTITVTFRNFNNDNGDSATRNVTFNVSVPAWTSYTVSYNANGGNGAPSSQTKWKNQTLTLSSSKPARNGYSFLGWSTSSSATTATYSAGGSYTANSGAILYAVWKANTYTVRFDDNVNDSSVSGMPSNQTKIYAQTLTLSGAVPKRTNYNFLGWSTSSSATTATYSAGGSYTANANVTLYAVWELAYTKPAIYNLTVHRCDSEGTYSDDGTYGNVQFDFTCTNTVTEVTIAWNSSVNSGYKQITDVSGTSGHVNEFISDLSSDASYNFTVTVTDTETSTSSATLNGSLFVLDALNGGKGIAFGKPAELENVADFAFDAKFNGAVYGNVLGLSELPGIPENAELNDYINTGCWAIQSNARAATITCGGVLLGSTEDVPPAAAGRFEVNSSTGEGIRPAQWSYLRQKFIPYAAEYPTYERDIIRTTDNVWRYDKWWRSTLNYSAADKLYHNQKILWDGSKLSSKGYYMTEGHTATLTSKVSEQPNGICLIFSPYSNGVAGDYDIITRFIPKNAVGLFNGKLHNVFLNDCTFQYPGAKALYVYDDRIEGYEGNNAQTTVNGLTFYNNKWILRYVIGV